MLEDPALRRAARGGEGAIIYRPHCGAPPRPLSQQEPRRVLHKAPDSHQPGFARHCFHQPVSYIQLVGYLVQGRQYLKRMRRLTCGPGFLSSFAAMVVTSMRHGLMRPTQHAVHGGSPGRRHQPPSPHGNQKRPAASRVAPAAQNLRVQ